LSSSPVSEAKGCVPSPVSSLSEEDPVVFPPPLAKLTGEGREGVSVFPIFLPRSCPNPLTPVPFPPSHNMGRGEGVAKPGKGGWDSTLNIKILIEARNKKAPEGA
jgi:hypothetical protein